MPKMARSEDLLTPPFLAAFAHVWEPRAFEPGDPLKYQLSMIFAADAIGELKKAATAVARQQWGDDIPANMKSPFIDAGLPQHAKHDGFEAGKVFIRATSNEDRPPKIVGPDVRPLTEKSDFYSGCTAVAYVNFFAWERRTGCGISCGLQMVQKIRDGEPLGSGSADPSSVFTAVGAPAADDFLS